jgi:WD40 repeat protein
VYDRDTRQTTETGFDAGGHLIGLTQTPDGERLFTQHGFRDPAVIAWRPGARGWERVWEVPTTDLMVHTLTVCPATGRVAVLTRTSRAGRWDEAIAVQVRSAATGAVEGTGSYPYTYGCSLLFSPDGDQLLAVHEMTLLAWPVPELGEPRPVRNDSRKHFTAAAYHPSGRYLFATSNDTTVHVFDAHTWERVARFTWQVGRLRSVAVSPDGSLAAAGGDKGEVVVWDVDL